MEDVVVCLKHESIVWLDGGLVAIETVRVHHSELTAANKTISGANLVTILVGDVVQVERQFLVGMALTTDNRRDQFLVCRSQTEPTAFSICQLEHLVAVKIPTAGRLPGFCGHQQRHQDLLSGVPVHLLAHYCFYTLLDTQTKIEISVNARSRFAKQASTKHELAAYRIGVLGNFTQARCKDFAQIQGFLLMLQTNIYIIDGGPVLQGSRLLLI